MIICVITTTYRFTIESYMYSDYKFSKIVPFI